MSETYWVRWRMYGPADAWNGDKFCDDIMCSIVKSQVVFHNGQWVAVMLRDDKKGFEDLWEDNVICYNDFPEIYECEYNDIEVIGNIYEVKKL